ncbi:phospholipid scramblase 1 [Physocladia obscura]|uniref:Phospholipid scramblase 1 n=1 Tax=Physocladia obscura TaxID=109957 RepID=A0AAD5T944_9FUNG|nr:phospholipid scramblase 1 [Physocladia obscura]
MEENQTGQGRRISQLRGSIVNAKQVDIANSKLYINLLLSESKDLYTCGLLPISTEPDETIFEACSDGRVLSRLINYAVPGTIKESKLNKSAKSIFQRAENLQIMLQGATDAGVRLTNIDPNDILSNNTTALLGLIWQILKAVDSDDLLSRLATALFTIKERDKEIEKQKERISDLEDKMCSLQADSLLKKEIEELKKQNSILETEKTRLLRHQDNLGNELEIFREIAKSRDADLSQMRRALNEKEAVLVSSRNIGGHEL